MNQKNLKKESINKPLKGFTLIELIVGITISAIACGAIYSGVSYIQSTSHKLKLKERAYEELKGYTELWKGKIMANDVSVGGILSYSQPICLDLDNESPCISNATLYADINLIDTGNSHAKRHGLKTRIEWETPFGVERELEFYIEQLITKE